MKNLKLILSVLVITSLTACTGQFTVTPNGANGAGTTTTTNNGSNTNGTSVGSGSTNGGTTTGNNNNTTPIDNTPIASGGTGLTSGFYKTTVNKTNFPLKVEKDGTILEISKTMFKPGELVNIKYTVPASYSDYAWVGVIPSRVSHGSERINDDNDVAYKYVGDLKTGVLEFTMPAKSGLYDFRLQNDDKTTGVEVSSLSFMVSESDDITDGTLKIQKTVFSQNEQINLDFTAPLEVLLDDPWVAIVPSNIPHGSSSLNDQHDVDYNYIDKAKGTVVFNNGLAPGNYDLRFNDKTVDGKELTYISFTIVGS